MVLGIRHSGEGGIHFDFAFCFRRAIAKTDSRPCEFRPPSWRPSYFSLLVQREVTKRKTPSRSRSRGHPCVRDSASRLRGSLRGHPCPLRERACLRARARVRSTRLILRLLAAAERDPEEQERGSPCRLSKAQKRGAEAKATRTNIPSSPRKAGTQRLRFPLPSAIERQASPAS